MTGSPSGGSQPRAALAMIVIIGIAGLLVLGYLAFRDTGPKVANPGDQSTSIASASPAVSPSSPEPQAPGSSKLRSPLPESLGADEPATFEECMSAAENDTDIWRCGRAGYEDVDVDQLYRDGLQIVPPDCSALPTETERDECKEDTYDNDDRLEYGTTTPTPQPTESIGVVTPPAESPSEPAKPETTA